MRPTRRSVLRAGLYGGALLAAGPSFFPSRRALAAPVNPAGTTLATTVRRGPEGRGGYRLLVAGPGEPHVVREAPDARPQPGRHGRRRPILVFAHLTDVHVIDAQSPARVEFLDRYSDGVGSQIPFDSAYRPQEMLTTQIADAMCRTLANLRTGPVTGIPVDFAVSTGDNIDNAQLNELRWFIDVLDGGVVTPDSGATDRWEGVHDSHPETYDVHYWHPEGTPARPAAVDDDPRRLYGFPAVPGLLAAARRPFDAHGLRMPWFAVFGNHDPLLQGNSPNTPAFEAIATGPLKVVALPAGASPEDVRRGLVTGDPATLQALLAAPSRVVTADPARRIVSRTEIMAEHFTTTGTPVGHGFTQANVSSGKGYYAFDHSTLVRCIVLDTVNPGGYSEGSIDAEQRDWLVRELISSFDRLVVVFSHHTSGSMTNPVLAPGETEPRVLGEQLVSTLGEFENVVLWVNGHTHRNTVTLHTGNRGSFWEVNTAAHVDFPSQSRIVELVDNRDGTLSIFATVVDLDVPLSYGGRLGSTADLASLARELGANDWQQRTAAREGSAEDRNVELVMRYPAGVPRFGRPDTCVCPPPPPGPHDGELPATGAGPGTAVAATAATAAALAAARWSGPRPAAAPGADTLSSHDGPAARSRRADRGGAGRT